MPSPSHFPPSPDALQNEADVEQKVIWPLLTSEAPHGLALSPQSIFIKAAIRRLQIDKGSASKLYYPDYAVSILGIPILIVEVKAPGVELSDAAREARLYAVEINATYRAGTNPCRYCVVSNGMLTELRAWDSDTTICSFSLEQASPASVDFALFVETLRHGVLQKAAAAIHKLHRPNRFHRPVNLVGGTSMRDERIEFNSFGKLLTSQFQHLFNADTWEDRQKIVQSAYVPSRRRERYIDEIDHIIKAAAPPAVREAQLIEDTSQPTEITSRLKAPQELRNKILLLVGAIGSGKSTFVDYLQEMALPTEVRSATAWVRLNMNDAPISPDEIYSWCRSHLIASIRRTSPDLDVTSLEGLRKLYKPQIAVFESGIGALFTPDSDEYKTRLADLLTSLQKDAGETLKAHERYLCTGRGRLLVVGLDNCDKRNRDEQLLMFQVAKWIQREVRCLIILPLRQETFENHRHEPPLDTALQDLIYRIQAPPFQEVLSHRLKLVMAAARSDGERNLTYQMGNARVTFPIEKLERFLRLMMGSLFENRRYGRNIIVGLAGWNIRRAFEIFLDFCRSGYLDEREIFQTQASGEHRFLQPGIIARVLFRTNRRYFDGDQSYVKNLFQCDASSGKPDHFVRYRILAWLRMRAGEKGDGGLRGFHRLSHLVHAIVAAGSDEGAARSEINYLLRAGCILSEHLRTDLAGDDDLIAITAAGHVHLELAHRDVHYLAACAEDTWLTDPRLAEEIHRRIIIQPFWRALSWGITLDTALDFASYLKAQQDDSATTPASFVAEDHRPGIEINLEPILKSISSEIERFQSKSR